MSWKTRLGRLIGRDVDKGLSSYGAWDPYARDITPKSPPVAYTPDDEPGGGEVPGTAPSALADARRLLETERAFAPHCDARILHSPGDCWACDLYPDWQALREKWGIAYTGHVPLTGVAMNQLPCPADYNRPPGSKSDHTRWGPNQAQGDKP